MRFSKLWMLGTLLVVSAMALFLFIPAALSFNMTLTSTGTFVIPDPVSATLVITLNPSDKLAERPDLVIDQAASSNGDVTFPNLPYTGPINMTVAGATLTGSASINNASQGSLNGYGNGYGFGSGSGSGFLGYGYVVAGGATAGTITYNLQFTPVNNVNRAGNYTVQAVLVASSPQNSNIANFQLVADTQGPIINNVIDAGATFVWTPAVDALSTVAKYEVFLDGGLLGTLSPTTTTYGKPSGLSPGTHVFGVRAFDTRDNIGPTVTVVFVVAAPNPTPTPTRPVPTPTGTRTPAVTVTATVGVTPPGTTPTVAATPVATPTQVPTATPTPVPAATPTPVRTPTLAPTATPTPIVVNTTITLRTEEAAALDRALDASLGVNINLNVTSAKLEKATPSPVTPTPGTTPAPSTGAFVVKFPATGTQAGAQFTGQVNAKLGNLEVNTNNGSGTAKLDLGGGLSVQGTAKLRTTNNSVDVTIEQPKLVLDGAKPDFAQATGGSSLVTQGGAKFDVGLNNLPDQASVTVSYAKDPSAFVGNAGAIFNLGASQAGGTIQNAQEDIAFAVNVQKTGITNADLGTNKVTLEVSAAWYQAKLAQGKDITITKVDDQGRVFSQKATCSTQAGTVSCTVDFTGDAAGFSTFAMIAIQSQPGLTATPVTTPTPSQGEGRSNTTMLLLVGGVLLLMVVAGAAVMMSRRRSRA